MTAPEPLDHVLEHVMVVSAMSRLARHGGWARILARQPLLERLDVVDAELLVEARVLRRVTADILEPVHSHPWHHDADALASGTFALLKQALRHAEGYDVGWSGDDLHAVVAQGEASDSAATIVGDSLLPLLGSSHAALGAQGARMLDVGVGIGAFSSRMCHLYPHLRSTGIDVLESVLDVARERISADGLADRIDLRQQSVADLDELAAYDLAWVPQAFIPPPAFRQGLRAVRRALRPDRWLVLLLAAAPAGATAFQQAVRTHGAHLTGGGPVHPDQATQQLVDMGFDRIRELGAGEQSVLVARRPGPE